MQTETTVTYHHTPVRIPRIKTSDNTMSLNVQDSAEKLDHSHNAGKTKHSGRLRQQKEKKKCNYHIIQQLYSWALILETGRLNAHTKTSTRMFTAALIAITQN